MSETKHSQVQDPQGTWKKVMDASIARAEHLSGEVARMQGQAIEQQRHAIDEMARLSKESLGYYGQLTASFWSLSLEATKKVADLVTSPKA